MKKLIVFCLLTGYFTSLRGQEVDDMYFRARDRKSVASVEHSFTSNYDNFRQQHFPEDIKVGVNPTDSYSGRQLNPEFAARSMAAAASADEENYFVENYRPSTSAVPFNNAYYFNNPWSNPWSMGWYSSAWARPWNNPWYWGWNDPWMNPWMPGGGWGWTPGWNYGFNSMWAPGFSGWTVSVGYTWGNAWGMPWCTPGWTTWNSWNAWNNWGMWNRPFIWSNEVSRVNYGKRHAQTNVISGDVRQHYNTSPRQVNSNTNVNTGTPSGRMRTDNTEYYVPPARRSAPARQNTSYLRDGNTDQGSPMRNWNNSGSSFNRNSGGMNNNRPSYTVPSRSSGSFNTGGARPSAPAGGGRRGGQ